MPDWRARIFPEKRNAKRLTDTSLRSPSSFLPLPPQSSRRRARLNTLVTFTQLQQEPNVTTKTTPPSPLLSSLLLEFLDDRALAELLDISDKTPAQWRHLGKFTEELPFYKFGRCVRYRREDVEAFIEKSRVGGVTIPEGA
ncbi:DNA-binding protein [Burkholderia ubonensis]|nr:hypothetical protein CJO70_12235 [Burkholderia ubonensis]PAJ94087.1 hypothetical protein CJO69_12850 [Burkholderia ubonensis]PAK09886.1 hypothetical protein CJO67_02210 [Burkholderia ubonensis]RQP79797.1 DNA-binding protein [Burkholderia ubonensis]RQP89885.1 DNA-binding protein [Burkholderia ubonensis]